MFKNIVNFLRHPIISAYNTGVQVLEKLSKNKIKKKLKDLSNLEERIEQYHNEGYTDTDILKHIKSREKANKMNKKAGSVLNELSLLPSLEFVGVDVQKKQVEARSSKTKIFTEFRNNLDKSISTILKRIESIGVDKDIIEKFKKAYTSASSTKVASFYKNNKDDFESIFVKYLGDLDDIEEILQTWTKELEA